jgi:uncharacterized protein YkwD
MFSKHTPVRPLPRLRQLSIGSISFVVLSLAFVSFAGTVVAQNVQPRPVARLMANPVNDAHYSRPRRVTSEAGHSAAISDSACAPTEVERRAFDKTNVARQESGLTQLLWDQELCRMARAHSERMALRGFFDHSTPEGLQLKDRAHENGILHFRVIAENIAYNKGYDDPGGFAVERWMISAGHRANILYVGFQASAIGSYVSADGSTYLTQVFIAR